MKEDLLKIINHYGVLPQLKYFQSEVFELNEAIINTNTFDFIEHDYPEIKNNRVAFIKHIAEEIADCYVMLEQFRLYYEIPVDKIRDYMTFKVKRQIERINNDKWRFRKEINDYGR